MNIKTMILAATLAVTLALPTLAHDQEAYDEAREKAFQKTTANLSSEAKLNLRFALRMPYTDDQLRQYEKNNQVMGIMWVLRAAAGIQPGDTEHRCYVSNDAVYYAISDGRLDAFAKRRFGKSMREVGVPAGPLYLEFVRSLVPEGCYPGTRWVSEG